MRLSALLLGLALAAPLVPWSSAALAADAGDRLNTPQDPIEADRQAFADLQAKAAEYQRNRATAPAEQSDDALALRYLERSRELLLTGHEIRARWWAEDGFEEHPYSRYAGDLLRLGLEGAAIQNNQGQVYEKLVTLWLFIPDYPGMGEAMERALGVAEDQQDFSKAVNLEASDPNQVVSLDGRAAFNDALNNRLFRFLSAHGDRESVAPRSALGLARSLLLTGSKEDLFEARRDYEQFLEDYPATSFTFPAICEYALSYLLAYRGSNYDVGALVYADALIDQAEIEARGESAKQQTVQAYRRRIRGWKQDRDLAVARWYVERGTPWVLQWLTMPDGLLEWDAGARRFYREVVKRDATSPQGRSAQAELADLPAPAEALGQAP